MLDAAKNYITIDCQEGGFHALTKHLKDELLTQVISMLRQHKHSARNPMAPVAAKKPKVELKKVPKTDLPKC